MIAAADMPRPRPPHLVRERTRHGAMIWYVRVGQGPRFRMREPYGTEAFWGDYRLALEGKARETAQKAKDTRGTLSWLIGRYMASPEWSALRPATRANRSVAFRAVEEKAAHEPFVEFGRASILASRDARRAKPHSANAFVFSMRALFAWAVENGLLDRDPTDGIKPLKGKNDDAGFHAWTDEEVERFQARWPLGTRERVAMDLLLYTGLRRVDAVCLGPTHVRRGEFTIKTVKTNIVVIAPILPPLAATLAKGPIGAVSFITKLDGAPFAVESFAYWFKNACVEAGVPGRAHGLRKAGARLAAEAGATEAQLNALFGWSDGSRESAVYTRTADRARMARQAPRGPGRNISVRDEPD